MKKVLKVFTLVVTAILLSGCESNEELVTECSLTSNNVASNYSLKSDYKIYSKGDIVTKVETTETVTSSTSSILDYFENYLSTTYKTYNDTYGGYENKITKEDDTLTSVTTINYSSMNLEKYVEDNSIMQNFLNDKNELTLEGVKSIYTSLGATCK